MDKNIWNDWTNKYVNTHMTVWKGTWEENNEENWKQDDNEQGKKTVRKIGNKMTTNNIQACKRNGTSIQAIVAFT
jgi:hypothetical protein